MLGENSFSSTWFNANNTFEFDFLRPTAAISWSAYMFV